MPPNVTISSVTAETVTVSWTQPLFSFTPAGYTITLTRVTGIEQLSCTNITDSRHILISANATTRKFILLHEFSTYSVTVTANFSEFDLSLSEITNFTSLEAGMNHNVQAL